MAEYHHPTLGAITVVRSSRLRRLGISIRATGEIRLSIPSGVSDRQAIQFLNEKEQWAVRTRERLARRYPHETIELPYATRSHVLQLNPCPCLSPSARIGNGIIRVSYPAALRYDAPEVQRIIQQGIEEAWRIEAKAYLPQRVDALCKTFGFRCGTVTIRNTRSRWGSCSSENNLSLSIHLMKLPDHLIDYVIVHELCHTLHKNHGAEFHQLLNRLTGGKHPQLRQELKNYTTRWR